jgi:hypothetical protein
MKKLRSEVGIAVGPLKKLQTIARAELMTPGSSARWGPMDLEATNALDSLSTAPALHPVASGLGRTAERANVEIAGDVDADDQ